MSTEPTHSAKKSLSNTLNRQAGLYSLAAAVAGVSMLALTTPASGEVVVTKKTIHIPMEVWGDFDHPIKVSMANNGVKNFSFNLYTLSSDRGLLVNGVSAPDGVITGGTFYAKALALPRGAKIGPSATFFNNYTDLIEATKSYTSSKQFRGYWKDSKDRYLGVRFPINGQTHYGWIRLTLTINPQPHSPVMSAAITGYAYETVPNKPILAGTAGTATAKVQAPENVQDQGGPSLGMLALGADGLPLWRREETLSSK